MSTKIVLADDHPIVRHGLRLVLETDPEFEVVGEASDGLEAIEIVETLQPHIFITDMMMPSLSGIETVRQIHQRNPRVKSLFFSLHNDDHYVHEAFRSGARGYLLKGATRDQILEAIHTVALGNRYIYPTLTDRLVNAYLERAGQFTIQDAYDELTAREREILQLVAEGATNNLIAERLFISPRTVEIHRANVMRKLNLKNHSELVRFTIKRGIISLEH